jgi:peroxiredoxin
LARLRDEYSEFMTRGAEVLAVGPDGPEAFSQFWSEKRIPFVGLADPDHAVAQRYQQEVNLFRLGRMPLVMVLDGEGMIRYIHYGSSMSDIPGNHLLLHAIDEIRGSAGVHDAR